MENKRNKIIEYSDKFIAYLDVLGFKNIVMSNNDISIQRLSEYLR